MRKALWALGSLLFAAVLVIALFVATYKPAQRPAPAVAAERTPMRLARGQYLVEHVLDCYGCHTVRDWTRFGGPDKGPRGAGGECFTHADDVPGKVCPSNLTSDRETGIGAWSDGEVLRAIREGVDRDGKALFPLMPYPGYRALSDEDALAVVAYLRTLPPVRHAVETTELDFPVSFFIKMVPQPLAGPVPEPDRAGSARYGDYLTTVAGCKYCHTPIDDKNQPVPGKTLAGGQAFKGPWGLVRSANLTSHPTGLGLRSRESFISLFRSFANVEAVARPVGKAGSNTVMPWFAYAGLKDEDLGAIYDYLRTVPPVANRVEKYSPQSIAAR